MAGLLRDVDPTIVYAVAIPLGIAIGAWALRMACSFCTVATPDFWQASLTFILICVANVVLRFWLRVTDSTPGVGTQFFAPLVTTAFVVAISLPTGPFTALVVSVVQGLICGMVYIGLLVLTTYASAALVF